MTTKRWDAGALRFAQQRSLNIVYRRVIAGLNTRYTAVQLCEGGQLIDQCYVASPADDYPESFISEREQLTAEQLLSRYFDARGITPLVAVPC